jgi:DNA-repair protein XRCC2
LVTCSDHRHHHQHQWRYNQNPLIKKVKYLTSQSDLLTLSVVISHRYINLSVSSHRLSPFVLNQNTASAPTGIPTPPFSGLSYLSSLHRGDILEIQGSSGSGKSHLLYYLICSCILPLRFGGWNKITVVFDTDRTFDIHRLETILRGRLIHIFSSDQSSTGQVISVALHNVHIFRPQSSYQLAAGLANLSSYHMSNLPTSEIALLAIDSLGSFFWQDRFAIERQSNTNPLATPIHTPSTHPLQTVLTALSSFRKSHHPVTIIVNRELGPADSVRLPFQLYKEPLPSFPNRIFPGPTDGTHFLTHRINLNLARVVPSPHNVKDEKRNASLTRRIDVHVQIKTGVDHVESLLMQINSDQVVIIMTHDASNSDDDIQDLTS